MLARDLIKLLEKCDPALEVVVDRDKDGWHAVSSVETVPDEDGGELVNITIHG